MSIVICAAYKNNRMFLASDTRAIKDGIVDDNFKKILLLRPDIYYSMTGIAEPGLWYFNRLQEMSHLSIIKLIEWIEKDFTTHGFPKLAIILSGKSKKNEFFIFTINSDGMMAKPHITNDSLAYVVSANDNIPLFSQYFENILKYGKTIKQAIIDTIGYASTIDTSISNKYDLVIVD